MVEVNEQGHGESQNLYFRTKTDDVVLADREHRIWVEFSDHGEPSPYIGIRNGLNALIGRNVYYQLVELGAEICKDDKRQFGVWSSGEFFVLGETQ